MNPIDPILLVVISLFGLRGFFKGLFREGFSLLGLFFGFFTAVHFDEVLAAWCQDSWHLPLILLKSIAFVSLFFAVYLAFAVLGWVLQRWAKAVFLEPLDRTGGAVLGLGKGTAVLALILFLLASFPFGSPRMKQSIDETYLGWGLYQLGHEMVAAGKASLSPTEVERGVQES